MTLQSALEAKGYVVTETAMKALHVSSKNGVKKKSFTVPKEVARAESHLMIAFLKRIGVEGITPESIDAPAKPKRATKTTEKPAAKPSEKLASSPAEKPSSDSTPTPQPNQPPTQPQRGPMQLDEATRNAIATLVKTYRKKNSLNGVDFGKLGGTTNTTVSRIEKGQPCSQASYQKIATAMGLEGVETLITVAKKKIPAKAVQQPAVAPVAKAVAKKATEKPASKSPEKSPAPKKSAPDSLVNRNRNAAFTLDLPQRVLEKVAEFVARYRETNGVTILQLAALTGMSPASVARLFKPQALRYSSYEAIAKATGLAGAEELLLFSGLTPEQFDALPKPSAKATAKLSAKRAAKQQSAFRGQVSARLNAYLESHDAEAFNLAATIGLKDRALMAVAQNLTSTAQKHFDKVAAWLDNVDQLTQELAKRDEDLEAIAKLSAESMKATIAKPKPAKVIASNVEALEAAGYEVPESKPRPSNPGLRIDPAAFFVRQSLEELLDGMYDNVAAISERSITDAVAQAKKEASEREEAIKKSLADILAGSTNLQIGDQEGIFITLSNVIMLRVMSS